MLEKCRILYKGDMMAGSFYLFVGMILLLFAIILHYFTTSMGYQYLSIGFFMFFIYCIGKGSVMFYVSRQKYKYFVDLNQLNPKIVTDEKTFTNYRITKKQTNRRRYIWSTVICCLVAVFGLFSPQKSIIMGTAIPIALISGIEFVIGLLTEFRLREFYRILNKDIDNP